MVIDCVIQVPDFLVATCVIEIMYRVYKTVATEQSSMKNALKLIDSSLPPDAARLFKTMIQTQQGDDLFEVVRQVVMALFRGPAFPPGVPRVNSHMNEKVQIGKTKMEEGWTDWGGDHLYMYERDSYGMLIPICVKYSLIRSLAVKKAVVSGGCTICIGLLACPECYSSLETFSVHEDSWIVLRFNPEHLKLIKKNVFPTIQRISPQAFL
jgi:hypothetical protein